jgi:hypothetical protein
MRSHPRAALVLAVVTLCLAGTRADEPGPAPFTLAIMRQDGIAIPFAAWTGKAVTNTWPVPEKEAETPITLEEIPKDWWGKPGPPTSWYVWLADGTTTEARMTAPTWFPAHCQQGVGVRTSLPTRQPLPPARLQPYPKVGVAASRQMDFQPIESLGGTAPIAKVLSESLRDLVNNEEDALVKSHLRDGWLHPIKAIDRHRVDISIEALYRTPGGVKGVFNYYFEGIKRYTMQSAAERKPASSDKEPCEVVTFVYGWFASRGEETSVKPRVWQTRLTSCDYESVDVMLPIAYVMMKGEPMWIVQFSGWGRETYALVDSDPGSLKDMIVWASHGGVCPSPAKW